jgi:hypothetical protein
VKPGPVQVSKHHIPAGIRDWFGRDAGFQDLTPRLPDEADVLAHGFTLFDGFHAILSAKDGDA